MEDLAEFAAAVTDFAAGAALTLVPAVPQHDYGPEVCLGPDTLDLPGFLALAEKLGGGVLYLQAVPFGPDDDGQLADAAAHLGGHEGEIGCVAVAFAANSIVHFWEHRAAWYLEWQDLAGSSRGRDDDEDQGGRLSDEERVRVAAELADTMLADPRFRAAQPGRRRQLAELAIPAGTDSRAGWDAASLACARAEELAEEQYGPGGRRRAVPDSACRRILRAGGDPQGAVRAGSAARQSPQGRQATLTPFAWRRPSRARAAPAASFPLRPPAGGFLAYRCPGRRSRRVSRRRGPGGPGRTGVVAAMRSLSLA